MASKRSPLWKARHDADGNLIRPPGNGRIPHATRSVTIHTKHGGRTQLDSLRLDQRSRAGKRYQALCKDMVAHLGGDATLPQSLLIQQAARLQLATDLAWSGV